MYDVLLVNLHKRGFEKVGKLTSDSQNYDFPRNSLEFRELCRKYLKTSTKNYLFLAERVNGTYNAVYYANYAKWMVEEKHEEAPYFIDVTSSDVKFLFHRAVNLSENDIYDCTICNKELNTTNPNLECDDCLERIMGEEIY